MRSPLLATLALGLSTLAAAGAAAPPPVEEIVAKANRAAYYQGGSGRARVEMVITDAQGRRRTRRLSILRRNDGGLEATGGDQKLYVVFHYPADVEGTAFLVWKHAGRDDDRWLYLPALDLVRRIAASDKRTSFVGSHFFYEDVSGRDPAEDVHERVETTEDYYVLRGEPKDPAAVEFSSYTAWIHRATFVPVKIEYRDEGGAVHRVYEALAVETVQGYPTVVKARMRDLAAGGETTIEYRDIRYELDLPEEIFSERYLRNPPRAHLP